MTSTQNNTTQCACSPSFDMRCKCFPDPTPFKARFGDCTWYKEPGYTDNWSNCPQRTQQAMDILRDNCQLQDACGVWLEWKIKTACELIGLNDEETKDVVDSFEEENRENDEEEVNSESDEETAWCFRCDEYFCMDHSGGDWGENEEWVCNRCLPTCLKCGEQLWTSEQECCGRGRSDDSPRCAQIIQALARGVLTRRKVHFALLSSDPDALARIM